MWLRVVRSMPHQGPTCVCYRTCALYGWRNQKANILTHGKKGKDKDSSDVKIVDIALLHGCVIGARQPRCLRAAEATRQFGPGFGREDNLLLSMRYSCGLFDILSCIEEWWQRFIVVEQGRQRDGVVLGSLSTKIL